MDDNGKVIISGRAALAAALLGMNEALLGMNETQAKLSKEMENLQARATSVGPALGAEARSTVKARRLVFQPRSEQRLRSFRSKEDGGFLQASDGTEYRADESGSLRKIVHVGAPGKVEHNKARIRRQRKAARR